MSKLKKYNSKRNFDVTNEPLGEKQIKNDLKFVVQLHTARKTHYDFRLQFGGVLLSWAVPKGPSFNPADKRLAVMVEDHPVEYANFEGVIPKGEYGGGEVIIWDNGKYVAENDFAKGLKNGVLKFELFGERLAGKWTLIRIKESENWLLIKEKDKFAKKTSNITKFKNSVVSGLTNSQLKNENNKNPFSKVEVMLAKLSETIPKGDNWIYEMKYDGYRIVAFIEKNNVKLLTRNNLDLTKKFEYIKNSLLKLANGRAMIFDGEIIASDEEGKPNFQLLQNNLKNKKEEEIVYVIFDILALDGEDLRNKKLIDRKNILKKLLKNCENNLIFSEFITKNGEKLFEKMQNMNLEGIVAKKIDSVYDAGRSENWVKIKCYKSDEFLVGGYTISDKKKYFSSLLLGSVIDGKLNFVGKVGTGFNSKDSEEIFKNYLKKEAKKNPFINYKKENNVVFVKPKLIVEVQYAEKTKENLLRQASFKCVRFDKNEFIESENFKKNIEKNIKSPEKKLNLIENVEISNPDKKVFKNSNIKKIDVVNYYNLVSKKMLPFLENRIVSAVRCHDGECFYKKHPSSHASGIGIKKIKSDNANSSEYFYIKNLQGLIQEVQFGTFEFHTWGSKVENIDKPDVMVFDLDPDKSVSLERLREGARDLKSILKSLNLKCFIKTSGGKGYHIVVPFYPSVSWEKFCMFSKNVAILMEETWPDKYTSNMRKNKRKGKIFVDWVRNTKGATSVAPYSLRANANATISMPFFWKELDDVTPDKFTIFNAIKRIKQSDPWKNFYKINQKLK